MQRIKSGSAGSAVPPQTQLPQQQALPTVNSFGAQPVHPIPENVSDVNGARRFLEHPRHETRRKLYDLPLFSGIPEEWPAFYGSLYETTVTYEYTNLENLLRLQRALQGNAKKAVESMLVHPDNVANVVEELKFRFGRPELIVKSQLDQIRKLPKMTEDNYSQLIEFSTRIRNFVAFMRSAKAEFQLYNPQLLEELVSRLPSQRRMDWAYIWSQKDGQVSIDNFSDWLSNVAKVASLIESTGSSAHTLSTNETIKRNVKKFTLYTATQGSQKSDSPISCRYCSKEHSIKNCSKFIELSIVSRWDYVKKNNICFSCLKTGHRMIDCRQKRSCNIENCNLRHHQLLHETKPKREGTKRPEETTKPEETVKSPVLNIHQSEDQVYFKVVQIKKKSILMPF